VSPPRGKRQACRQHHSEKEMKYAHRLNLKRQYFVIRNFLFFYLKAWIHGRWRSSRKKLL